MDEDKTKREDLDSHEGGSAPDAPAMPALAVSRDGDTLMVQSTGQPPVEIYPESETEFFIDVVDAQITFVKGEEGRVDEILLRQRGQESAGRRK